MDKIQKNPSRLRINQITSHIKEGSLIIYPTETSYALGCSILNEKSLKRIYKLKRRRKDKYLTCIVSDLAMASEYCYLNEKEREICRRYMPGPLTLVAKKKKNVSDLLNKDFVFRISSNQIARSLTKEAEVPLVATSANIAGGKEPYSIKDVPEEMVNGVDWVIDGGELEGKNPSTIIKLRPGFQIVRHGPLELREG